jgi:hypothetical protein
VISSVWSASTATTDEGIANRYGVAVERDGDGWVVRIVDPNGLEASRRACRDEREARTFVSTVRQHIGWLSESTFRAYYALTDEG